MTIGTDPVVPDAPFKLSGNVWSCNLLRSQHGVAYDSTPERTAPAEGNAKLRHLKDSKKGKASRTHVQAPSVSSVSAGQGTGKVSFNKGKLPDLDGSS